MLSLDFIKVSHLPDFPGISNKINYPLAQGKIKLLKWIPSTNTFKALIIAGFPESTGKEAEICIDTFNRLKVKFKNYKLKMGVSSGVVFAGEIKTKKFNEFSVLGDSVNVAARLCSIAPENSLYLSEEVQKALKGRFSFVDIGAIKLKGKEDRIRIYRLQEKVSNIFNPALFNFKFTGRDREFTSALNTIRKNKSLCFIGDGGTGKSRMLFELRKKIKQKNLIEVAPLPVSPPLFLLKEIFKYFPEGEFPDLKNYFDGTIQLPQIRILELLKTLFKAKSNLIIFIEDLQWIDEPSFMLIKELTPLPFLIIASSRKDGEKFADILRMTKIFLSNLSPQSLKNLSKTFLGAPPDKKLFKFLVEHTQGNPFYLEQIMRDLQKKFYHYIAACIGMEFSENTIKRFFGDRTIDFKPIIDSQILLKTGGIYQFKHSLFREAILDSQLESKRKEYEKMLGEVFIKENRGPYEIARYLTDGGEAYKALPYWSVTFYELCAQGLHSEIAKIIQNLGNYEDVKIKNLSAFINALYLIKVSDYYDAEQILLRLEKIKPIKKEVLFQLAGLYDWSTQYPKMVKILKKLENYPMSIRENLSRLELWGIYYDMNGKNREALKNYQSVLNLARQKNYIQYLFMSYYNVSWIFFKQCEYPKAEKYFLQSLKYVKEGDLFGEGTVLLRLGQIEMLKQNFEISLNYLKKSLKNFQVIDFPYWEALVLDALANLYVLVNKRQRALWFARKSDEIEKMANLSASHVYMFHLYYGNLHEFEKLIEGREKQFYHEYFLYLLAKKRKDEAFEFLRRNNLESIIPDKKALKQKKLPLSFL